MRVRHRLSRASVALLLLGLSIGAFSLTFTKLAGPFGGPGFDDGTGTAARFNAPSAVAVDASNNVYVADTANHTIRKIFPGGEVTTLAGLAETGGSTDGKGAYARFYSPQGITVDSSGTAWVSDTANHVIRRISDTGIVTTYAGTAGSTGFVNATGSTARFSSPRGIAVDTSGNLYVCDYSNNAIRKIAPGGAVSTLAGGSYGATDGTGTGASFRNPTSIAWDSSNNVLFVGEGNAIRKITLPGAVVTTLATIGLSVTGVAVDSSGNVYASADQTIQIYTAAGAWVGAIGAIGQPGFADATGSAARLNLPGRLAVRGTTLYVADSGNDSIRALDTGTNTLSTLAGAAAPSGFVDATGSAARFSAPAGVAYYPGPSGFVYVSDNNAIRRVGVDGAVTTLAGGTFGYANGQGAAAQFKTPEGLALRLSDLAVFVADRNNHCIRLVDAAGNASLFAGQPGVAGGAIGDRLTTATFSSPRAVALNGAATVLYVADYGTSTIRKIDLTTGAVSNLATNVWSPAGLMVDGSENVYATQSQSYTIVKITPAGVVTTFAGSFGFSAVDGTGTGARFGYPGPVGLSGSPAAGEGHVADRYAYLIRTLRLSDANVSTTGGKVSTRGAADGTGPFARFMDPRAVSSLGGSVAVADGHTIRLGSAELTDRAVVDTPTTLVGTTRQLDTSPQTATSWTWSIIRRPSGSTATLSSTSARNPAFTPDVADLYVFRCIATSSSGTSISTVSLQAWSPPTATVSGGGRSCGAGSPATITASLTGAAPWSITWSDGVTQSGLTSPLVTRIVTPSSPTTYSITAVSDANATGSSSGSAPVTVSVPPTAVATGTTICPLAQGTVSVSLTGTPPWTLYWADGLTQSGINSSPATRAVTPSASTTYVINTVSDANCTVASGSSALVSVVPASVVIAAPIYVCGGAPTTASVPDLGPSVTYSWQITNGVITAGDGTRSITYTAGGSGSVGLSVTVNGPSCSASGNATIPIQQCGGSTPAYVFTHVAGSAGGGGTYDGTGTAARFFYPTAVALDSAGNIYVTDQSNHVVRKIAPDGVVRTLAGRAGQSGSVDGHGSSARFTNPTGIAVDSAGNVYVSDVTHIIRKISPSGAVSTLAGTANSSGSADGTGAAARFYRPAGLAIDGSNNLYVADSYNHTIRKVTQAGEVTTIAGLANNSGSIDAVGTAARFYRPSGLAFGPSGVLYVADHYNNTIRAIATDLTVTTFAGQALTSGWTNATGSAARFNRPFGIAVDASGNIFVGDQSNHMIRKINSAREVTTWAGQTAGGTTDGAWDVARFLGPSGIALDGSGNLFVADQWNYTIRKITPLQNVSTLAGQAAEAGSTDDTGSAARFNGPWAIGRNSANELVVADTGNHTIRKIAPNGAVTTMAGAAGLPGDANATGTAARFEYPAGIAIDASDNVFVADSYNHIIRKITTDRAVTTFAGLANSSGSADGALLSARFNNLVGAAIAPWGSLYVADTANHKIRKIEGGVVTTIAGTGASGSTDGAGTAATFNSPYGVAADALGNLFVADRYNYAIRKITPAGVVTTFAGQAGIWGSANGTGSAARFSTPSGIATDPAGNVFVADTDNNLIRMITSAGVVSTVAGLAGTPGCDDGIGSEARFYSPYGLTVDSAGQIFVTDGGNNAIRLGRLALPDRATIDTANGTVGVTRQLGVAPLNATSFTWRIVRVPSASNASLSSTTISNPTFTPDAEGRFEFLLTASNSVSTSISVVALEAHPAPTATVSGGGLSCGPAGPAVISAALTGTAPWSITWSDGVTQSNVLSSPATRTVSPVEPTNYTVTAVADAYASGTSSGTAPVTVAIPPTAIPTTTAICLGSEATIQVTLTGTAPWSITWADGLTQSNILSSPATRLVSPTSTQAYTISSLSDATCTVTPNVSVTVPVVPAAVTLRRASYVCSSSTGNEASVPPFAGATYAWTITNGTITQGDGTNVIVFSASGAGSVQLGVTVSATGSSCASAGATIPLQTCGASPPALVFTTLAGTGLREIDGPAASARFDTPYDAAFDASGNLYVADTTGQAIRKITPAGFVSTLAGLWGITGSADGKDSAARLLGPNGIATDTAGNVYVLDRSNATIRKISPSGVVSTLAGLANNRGHVDGQGSAARFQSPEGLSTDSAGNLYVADSGDHTIRKVTPAGMVSTIAGSPYNAGGADGTGSAARFYYPGEVIVTPEGDLLVSEWGNCTIRKITQAGVVTTIAGAAGQCGHADANGIAARFLDPQGMVRSSAGDVYVADTGNNVIRRIAANGDVTTFAGLQGTVGSADGTGSAARFSLPIGVTMDPSGNLIVTEYGNHTIRKITVPGAVVTTLAGSASGYGYVDDVGAAARFNYPAAIALDAQGNILEADLNNGKIRKILPDGTVSTWVSVSSPSGLAIDGSGNVYASEYYGNRVLKITPGGTITTLAGSGSLGSLDGTGTAARFRRPRGLAITPSGDIYVADYSNHTIRKITSAGVVTTIAGSPQSTGSTDGLGSAARFNSPWGVAVDSAGNVYVADTSNHTIRKVTPAGVVTTLAGTAGSPGTVDGTGPAARFVSPRSIAIDSLDRLYVACGDSMRMVTLDGVVTTLAGKAFTYGWMDGTGSSARFNGGYGVAITSDGTIYRADAATIRAGRLAIPDAATIDAPAGVTGQSRQLDVTPQNATSYSWRVLRYPSGSSGPALSSTTIRNPTFTPDAAGRYEFEVTASNAIAASITSVALDAAPSTHTWTGAQSGTWTTAANWANSSAPLTGGDLVFPAGPTTTSVTNDYSGLAVRSLSLSDGYTLSGNALIVDDSVTIAGGGTLNIPLSGTASLTKSGSGFLAVFASTLSGVMTIQAGGVGLTGANTSAGAIDMTGGSLQLVCVPAGALTITAGEAWPYACDSVVRGLTVAAGGALRVDADVAPAHHLRVIGTVILAGTLVPNQYFSTVAGPFTIIENDDSDPVSGTFAGLPEGTLFTHNGRKFRITYAGGDGNDVVITPNTAPTITAASPVGRTAGSAGTSATIATVSDAQDAAGTLTVTATSVPNGLTVGAIVNTGGTITATVAASCSAAAGANGITLQVQDSGGLTATATFTVNVTANTAPAIGDYPPTSIAAGGSASITPASPPADNGSVAQVTVVLSNGFTGSASVNAGSGVVSIGNANAGIHTGTVTVTDNCGTTYSKTFTLTVSSPFGAPVGVVATAITSTRVDLAWVPVMGATSYDVFRREAGGGFNALTATASASLSDNTVQPNRTYLYQVRAVGATGASSFSAPDPATTVIFENDPLSAGTIVRATHVNQLRTAVNAMRALAGLTAATFTDPSLAAGIIVRRQHVVELRQALSEARSALALAALTLTDANLTTGTPIRRAHVQELRDGVR